MLEFYPVVEQACGEPDESISDVLSEELTNMGYVNDIADKSC